MSLNAITLRNWRSFKEQRVELRPLTLIYGDNNAGKSALLRAVVALSERVSQASGGLNWRAEVLSGADFASLLRKGISEDEEAALGWTLHTDEGVELSCALKWFAPWEEAVLTRFEARRGERWLRLEWVPVESERMALARSYQFSGDQHEAVLVKAWCSMMLPTIEDATDAQSAQLGAVWGAPSYADKVEMARVQWLRAGRAVPQIAARQRRFVPWLTSRGLGAVELLEQAPAVYAWVQERFAACTRGYTLRLVNPDSKNVKAVASRHGFDVDVTELGDGVQGLLPTLTALGWMACGHNEGAGEQEGLDLDGLARRLSGPTILALEEPESQLHPTLQRELGAAMCEAVRAIKEAGSGRKLLVETHSDVLLMTVQLAIARGVIAPSDVAIYWVKQDEATGVSEARQVEIDASAALGWEWPLEAFELRRVLAAELVEAMASGPPSSVRFEEERAVDAHERAQRGRRR